MRAVNGAVSLHPSVWVEIRPLRFIDPDQPASSDALTLLVADQPTLDLATIFQLTHWE